MLWALFYKSFFKFLRSVLDCVYAVHAFVFQQDIVAQPDFTVEIQKPTRECLSFECYFPDDELNEEGDYLIGE